jgi:hypothetical protein
MVTIFGYGAPKSDTEAVDLMKAAWGKVSDRNLEQVEIIDSQARRRVGRNLVKFHTLPTITKPPLISMMRG